MSAPNFSLHNDTSSILEQIQIAEHECVQQVQAAEQRAEEQIRAAHQQATEIKHDAADAGHGKAGHAYQDVIAQARREAREMVAQAKAQAAVLAQLGDDRVREVADWALALVTGEREGRDT